MLALISPVSLRDFYLPSSSPKVGIKKPLTRGFSKAQEKSLLNAGWLTPPADWVEPAIALSVVLATFNNLLGVSSLKRWRLAFVFGLVHGFSFASVLMDLGLPASALFAALGGFNLGVELGQLAIVGAFLPLSWAIRQTLFYRWVVVTGGSLAVVLLGLFWTVQRMGWLN